MECFTLIKLIISFEYFYPQTQIRVSALSQLSYSTAQIVQGTCHFTGTEEKKKKKEGKKYEICYYG